MVLYIAVVTVVLAVCIVLVLLIRSNRHKLKKKSECGKIIEAKIKSWKEIPGRPTRYIIRVEYETDKKRENKVLITSGKFARKYEYEKSIQIVVIPNSNKVFFEEEDWKTQNIWLVIFAVFFAAFLMQLLVVGVMRLAELR